jgi:hypothetical protein
VHFSKFGGAVSWLGVKELQSKLLVMHKYLLLFSIVLDNFGVVDAL